MNCENCQSALLDLVYDDLEESREVEARKHIEQCEACRLSFQKLNEAVWLAVQLPQLDPSERVCEKVRAAAYQKVADRPKRSAVSKASIQDNLRRLVGFVGHLAMGRQVAMAMVMLLIVAFGLHFLPHLRRTPKATRGTVVNPDGSGEVGPSSELTPAEPFDLTVDLPRGRIRSKESVENDIPSKDSVALTEAENAKRTRRESTKANRAIDKKVVDKSAVAEPVVAENKARRRGTDDIETVGQSASSSDRSYDRDKSLVAESKRGEIAFAGKKMDEQGGASISSSAATPQSDSERQSSGVSRAIVRYTDSADEPLPFPNRAQPAAKQTEPEPPASAPFPNRAQPAAKQTEPEPPANAPFSNESETADRAGEAASDEKQDSPEPLYRRGVASYRSGDYSSAISDLSRVKNSDDARELRPQTLYYLARSYQASGQYSLAVNNYRLLISGFPRHSQTGPAMLEAARCLQRLGKVEEARELLERASLIPAVAEQARRELISLE